LFLIIAKQNWEEVKRRRLLNFVMGIVSLFVQYENANIHHSNPEKLTYRLWGLTLTYRHFIYLKPTRRNRRAVYASPPIAQGGDYQPKPARKVIARGRAQYQSG
jgi:hypothetical protein